MSSFLCISQVCKSQNTETFLIVGSISWTWLRWIRMHFSQKGTSQVQHFLWAVDAQCLHMGCRVWNFLFPPLWIIS
ncbi:unnamed protein product [Blepharisma stoltei]|uniref:Uncharacterized protein n=1 Tax=Blepharisma stoltei TaxID=1481888 RepID=A0AAU9I9G8_9CILI|nr:unnamed protein product [Blepharisma stoltei]